MADVKMVIAGDAANLINQYQKVIDAEKQYARSVGSTAAAINRREQDMQQAMAKLNLGMKDAERQGAITFKGLVDKLGLVEKALNVVTAAGDRAYAAVTRAAQNKQSSVKDVGELGQLARSEAHMKQLVDASYSLRRQGVTETIGEAARMVFQFESTGLKEGDQKRIAALKKFGVVNEADDVVKSIFTVKQAMGAEAGDFTQLMSKGFAAAGPTPGKFQELMMAASSAAPQGKVVGWKTNDILAAVGTMAKQENSPAEAATTLQALAKAANERNMAGRTIEEVVREISDAKLTPQQLQAIFPRVESMKAFQGLSENLGQYRELRGNIYGATNADLGTRQAQIAASSPDILAGVAKREGEGFSEFRMRERANELAFAKGRIAAFEDGSWKGGWMGLSQDAMAEWVSPSVAAGGQTVKAQQIARLQASAGIAEVGPAVQPPDRPYVRKGFVTPQVPDTEDPAMVAANAELAKVQLQRNELADRLFEKFAGADGIMSDRERTRLNKDSGIKSLDNTLERLTRAIDSMEMRKRLNAAESLRGVSSPPR
jgi:hypothetical protein